MDASKLFKSDYLFTKGETVVINGRLARGTAEVIDVSYDTDSPLADVETSPVGESNGRPMPPHVRVKMNGKRTVGAKAGSSTGTFLYHADDIISDKIQKVSEIDFL